MVSIGKWSVLIFVILCACPGSLSEDTKKESVETVSLPQPQNIGPTPQNANKGTSEDVAAHMWQAPYEIHMVGDPREMRSGWIYQFGNQHPAAGDSQIYQGVPQEHWHKQLDAQVQSFAPSYRNIDQNSVAFNEVDPYAAYRAVGSPYPAAPKSWGPTQIKQTVNGQPDAPERDMSHMEIIKQAWEKSNLNVQKVAPQPKQVNDDAAKRPELPPLIFPKDVGQSDVIGASPLEPCSGEVLLSPEQPQILAQQPNQFEPQLRQQMPMLDRNPQQQPIQQSTLQQQPMQQQPMQQRPMQQPTLQQQPMQQQPMQQQPMQQSTLQQPNLQQQPMQLPTFQQRIPMNGQNFNVQQQPMGTPTNLRQQMPMYDQTQNMQPQQQIDPIAQIPDTNLRQQMPMYAPTQNLQRTPSNAGQIPADNLRQQMMVPAQQKTSLKQSDERQLAQQQQFQLQQAPGLVQGQNLRQQMTALSDLDQRQMPQQQVAQQQTIAFAQPQTMNQQPMLQQDQSQTSNQRQMPQTQTFTVANSRIQGENVQPATQQQASQNLVLNVNPDQQHMFIIDQQMPQSRLQQPAPQQQMLIPTQNTPQQMTFTQNAQQQPMYLPEQHPVVQQQQMPSFAQNLPSTNVDQMPTWGQTQDNQPQMPTSLNVQMQTENMPYQPSNQQIDQVKLDEMKAIMEDMPDVRTIHLIKKLKKQQNHQPNVYITIPAVYGGYAGGYSSPSSYARPSSYYRSSSYGYGNSPWIGSSNPATTGSDQPAQTSGGPANSKSDSSSAPGSPTDKSSLTGDEFQEMIASENITTSRTLHTSPIAAEDDDLIAAASEADTVEIRDESDGRVCNCKHNHIEQDDDEEHHVAAVPIDIHPDGRFVSSLSGMKSSGFRHKRQLHSNHGYVQELNEAINIESSSSLDPLDTLDAVAAKPRQGRYTPQSNAFVDFNPNQYLPVREIDLNSKDQAPSDSSNIYKNLVQQTEQSIREAIAKATRSSGPVQVVNEPDVAPTTQYSSDPQEQAQIIPLDEYLRQNPPAMRKTPMRVNLNSPAPALSAYHRPSLAGISDQAPVSLQRNPFETWYKPPSMMKHPLQVIIQSIESRLSSCCESCKAEVLNEISEKLRLNADGSKRTGHKCSRTGSARLDKPIEHEEDDQNSEEFEDSEEVPSQRTQINISGRVSGPQETRTKSRYSSKQSKTSRKKTSDYESNEEVEDDSRTGPRSKSSRNENRRKLKAESNRATNRTKSEGPRQEPTDRSQDRRKSTSSTKSSKFEKLIQRLIELEESIEAREYETTERRPKKSREDQSIRKSKMMHA